MAENDDRPDKLGAQAAQQPPEPNDPDKQRMTLLKGVFDVLRGLTRAGGQMSGALKESGVNRASPRFAKDVRAHGKKQWLLSVEYAPHTGEQSDAPSEPVFRLELAPLDLTALPQRAATVSTPPTSTASGQHLAPASGSPTQADEGGAATGGDTRDEDLYEAATTEAERSEDLGLPLPLPLPPEPGTPLEVVDADEPAETATRKVDPEKSKPSKTETPKLAAEDRQPGAKTAPTGSRKLKRTDTVDDADDEAEEADEPKLRKDKRVTAHADEAPERSGGRFAWFGPALRFIVGSTLLVAVAALAVVALMPVLNPPAKTDAPPDTRAELEQLSRDVKAVKPIATDMKRLDGMTKDMEAKASAYDKAAAELKSTSATLLKDLRGALPANTKGGAAKPPEPTDVFVVITHGSTFDADRYTKAINGALALRGKAGVGRIGVGVASTDDFVTLVKLDAPAATVGKIEKVAGNFSEAPDRVGLSALASFTDKARTKRKVVLVVSSKCEPLTDESAGWAEIPGVDVVVVPSVLKEETGESALRRLSRWHEFAADRVKKGLGGSVRWIADPDADKQNALVQAYLEYAIRQGN